MTAWEYVGVEVSTGQVLATLPVRTDVKFTRALNGYGSFSGTVPLRGRNADRRRDMLDAVDCGRRAIYALADGQPVWGGICWTDPDQGDDAVQVTATEWGGYYAKTPLAFHAPSRLAFTGADQLHIAREIIKTVAEIDGGDVLVAIDETVVSGVTRDRTYLAGDLPVAGELLANLGNVDNGFDWAWPAEWADPTHLRGRLLLGHPRLGAEDAAYVVEAPGRSRAVSMSRGATDMATTAFAVGKPANDGDPTPIASATDPALVAAGYPYLARVERYQDVTDTGTLQEHADADQKAYGGPLAEVAAAVPLADVLDGSVNLGDPVRVELATLRHPDGFIAEMRCTEIEFDPTRGVAGLTLSPRVEIGGRVPRREDEDARQARLSREVRLLSVSR